MLFVVATPIGNMKDITYRAVERLSSVSLILAEDTRRTGKLCKEYKISTLLSSFNDHNKEKKTPRIIKRLITGDDIAIVSDAGMPGISDPGFYLVRACRKQGVSVTVIPGACAAVTGLSGSGLPTDTFTFRGFLPKKVGKKASLLELPETGTLVFYESPHRIRKTIKMICEKTPGRKIVIARELTKRFEEWISGTAKEVLEKISDRNLKGEITLILEEKRQ